MKGLLAKERERWRQRQYDDLVSLIDGEPVTGELFGEGGIRCGFDSEVIWDRKPAGDIRVRGMIDDGGIRALFPLSNDFTMASDGGVVEEDPVSQADADRRPLRGHR